MCEVICFEILIGPQRALKMHPVDELSIRCIDQIFPLPFIEDYYVPSSYLLRNGYIGVRKDRYIYLYIYIDIYIYIHLYCIYRVWYLTRQTDNLAPLRSYNDRYPRAQRVQQWCSARTGVYRPICGFMPAVCMRRSHFAAIMIER